MSATARGTGAVTQRSRLAGIHAGLTLAGGGAVGALTAEAAVNAALLGTAGIVLMAVGGQGDGGMTGQGASSSAEPPRSEPNGKSRGRIAQESGDAYEDFLMEKLGGTPGPDGRPGFKTGGRQFDGTYTDPETGIDTWYEAKSGRYWDRVNSNKKEMLRFKSKLGDARRIARENDAQFGLISENEIPDNIASFLSRKGIPWRIIPRE